MNHLIHYGKKHEIVLVFGGQGVLKDYCSQNGILHYQIPFEKKWKTPLGFYYILKYLSKHKPDVVVLHGQWAGFFGAIAAYLHKIPSFYIVQWPVFYTDWDFFRLVRNHLIEFITCRLSSLIAAISYGNYREYLFRFPFFSKKISLFSNPNTITLEENMYSSAISRDKLGWEKNEIHVLCLSRFSTQKRIDWLLQAWAKLEKEISHGRLWIAGDGELMRQMIELAKTLKLNRLTFLGARKDTKDLLSACDIVVMPTMYEGHANVPLEAMAFGKPIVACDVDGVRESFQNEIEGILVRPGDVHAFSDAIKVLIQSKETRVRMGQAGLLRVRKFDLEKVMEKFLKKIEEIVEISNKFNKRGE
ncbi:MAG: glycosyltransferase [Chthoniobacterales bacterium]|nr:glycosyltransferase [Chthoniobacterales bacterium]